jgi:hypothetical protein
MRVTRLIPYICGEYIYKNNYSTEKIFFTLDININIYLDNYLCYLCKTSKCPIIICQLYNYNSKITCDKFVRYRYHCVKNLYSIRIDDEI